MISTATVTVKNFNPRPREGSDVNDLDFTIEYLVISIHAPVKGATYN